MSELKPCPFCGTTVVSIEIDGLYRWVECGNASCLASVKPRSFLVDAGNANHIVATDWNTRPIEDALRAENERLQAYASRLLFEDSRLWHCRKCGSEFSSFLRGQPEIPNAEMQCPICEEGVAVPKAWIMQNEIARLRKALEEQQRWTPVSERLPEVDTRVEIFDGFEQTMHIGYYREHATQWDSEDGRYWHGKNFGRITHWRPLPEPPEEK